MIWTTSSLSEALGVAVPSQIYGGQIQFNSLDVQKDDLFIALTGNRDGHDYVHSALEKGASAVIISKEIDGIDNHKAIKVNNTFDALKKMALYKRANSQAKFIGITGSVGKTTTKETINIILSSFDKTFASRGNFNNYLGVLINLASIPNDVKYAIFEMGMNHAGEIKELSKLIKPDIAIITNISEAHIEFFDSILEIVNAKCEIFEGLSKDGTAIINLDSPYYNNLLKTLSNINIATFGKGANTNAQLKLYKPSQTEVELVYLINEKHIEIKLPFIPKHYAENFTIALLVADLLRKNLEIAAMSLKKMKLTEGRGEIININNSNKNYRIISDYYNASPASMKAALKYLKQVTGEKKTVILGEMLELGTATPKLHQDLVPYIIDSGCSKVILVGSATKFIYNLLPKNIIKIYFDNVDLLIKDLANLLENNELILIKGSRGIKLDKILTYLKDQNAL